MRRRLAAGSYGLTEEDELAVRVRLASIEEAGAPYSEEAMLFKRLAEAFRLAAERASLLGERCRQASEEDHDFRESVRLMKRQGLLSEAESLQFIGQHRERKDALAKLVGERDTWRTEAETQRANAVQAQQNFDTYNVPLIRFGLISIIVKHFGNEDWLTSKALQSIGEKLNQAVQDAPRRVASESIRVYAASFAQEFANSLTRRNNAAHLENYFGDDLDKFVTYLHGMCKVYSQSDQLRNVLGFAKAVQNLEVDPIQEAKVRGIIVPPAILGALPSAPFGQPGSNMSLNLGSHSIAQLPSQLSALSGDAYASGFDSALPPPSLKRPRLPETGPLPHPTLPSLGGLSRHGSGLLAPPPPLPSLSIRGLASSSTASQSLPPLSFRGLASSSTAPQSLSGSSAMSNSNFSSGPSFTGALGTQHDSRGLPLPRGLGLGSSSGSLFPSGSAAPPATRPPGHESSRQQAKRLAKEPIWPNDKLG